MRSCTKYTAVALSAPLALVTVAGPLAASAAADPPWTGTSSFAVVPGSFVPVSAETTGPITRITFIESTIDQGPAFPSTTVTTWTCLQREGAATFRCRGEGESIGTYEGVTGPATLRINATCSETSTTPVVVTCEGRFTLDGEGALEGLRGQATWQSSGVFGLSVRGTSQLRLHDHR